MVPATDRRTGGFTLMELLVALTVLAALMVALNQGARLGLRSWDAQSRTVSERDQLDAADRALRRLVGQLDSGGENEDVRLTGTPDRFDFRSELPGVVSLLTRRIDASLLIDGNHRFVLRWTPHLHEQRIGGALGWTDTELLSGVERVKFSYWHAPNNDGSPGGWRDDWSEPTAPLLVKIHLFFRKGDPRHWPDLVIAPRIEHAAS